MPASYPFITPPSSGNLLFITLKGQFQGMGQVPTEITRPGVDGYAMRLDGKRAKPFQMTGTVDCDSSANSATVYLAAYRALQGQLVSIQDDYGAFYEQIMVLDIEKVDQRPVVSCAGGILAGAATSLLTVRFTLQDTRLTV